MTDPSPEAMERAEELARPHSPACGFVYRAEDEELPEWGDCTCGRDAEAKAIALALDEKDRENDYLTGLLRRAYTAIEKPAWEEGECWNEVALEVAWVGSDSYEARESIARYERRVEAGKRDGAREMREKAAKCEPSNHACPTCGAGSTYPCFGDQSSRDRFHRARWEAAIDALPLPGDEGGDRADG